MLFIWYYFEMRLIFTEHEPLQPRLRALMAAHQEDLAKATELENRIGTLLEKHATKVRTNDILCTIVYD
jgi:hypothetical protein